MTHLVPGRDPLGFLEFVTSATQIRFEFPIKVNWSTTRQDLIQTFDPYFEGMFDIVLGDEKKLTDISAEYVLYIDEEEAEKARAGIAALQEKNK